MFAPRLSLPMHDSVSHGIGLRVVTMNDVTNAGVNKVGFFDGQSKNYTAQSNEAGYVYPYAKCGNEIVSLNKESLFVLKMKGRPEEGSKNEVIDPRRSDCCVTDRNSYGNFSSNLRWEASRGQKQNNPPARAKALMGRSKAVVVLDEVWSQGN